MLNNTDDDIDFLLSIPAYSLLLTQKDPPWFGAVGSIQNMKSPGASGPPPITGCWVSST